MLWIRVASDLSDSPKIGLLARELRVTRDAAMARILTLWGWVARHAPTGNLENVPDSEVAQGAKWRGRPERFVAGMQAAGLMDERQIHDWTRMNGRALAECSRVKSWKEQQKVQRQKAEPVTRIVTRSVTDERNVTVRNKQQPTTTPRPPSGGSVWGWWVDCNRAAGRKDPSRTGADTKAAKAIAGLGLEPEEVKDVLRKFLADKTRFVKESGYALRHLPGRIDAYRNDNMFDEMASHEVEAYDSHVKHEDEQLAKLSPDERAALEEETRAFFAAHGKA